MVTDLNPNDVAAWMRERARVFIDMADEIEKTFKIRHSVPPPPPLPSVPLSDRIHKLLADGKARRAPGIAKDLGVPPSQVRKVVENNGSLSRNERGWITIVKSLADEEVHS
ncbi:MAG: hypothetical protein V1790_19075 [Planctomycetota bacterium]